MKKEIIHYKLSYTVNRTRQCEDKEDVKTQLDYLEKDKYDTPVEGSMKIIAVHADTEEVEVKDFT